jgi:hypothetical protein
MSEVDAVSTSPFSYSISLVTDGDIRLLEPTNEADGLHLNIRSASLDNPQLEYDALSYVWGSHMQTFPIICNGYRLHVHGNLHSALPFLARRYEGAKSRPIWIDAICYNQNDLEEKLVHINMIEKIYSSAATVWVWLSIAEKQEQIPEAIALLPKLNDAGNEIRKSLYSLVHTQHVENALHEDPDVHIRDKVDQVFRVQTDVLSAVAHL